MSDNGTPLVYLNQSFFNTWSVLTIIIMLISNQLGMYIPGKHIQKLSISEVIRGSNL